MLYSISHERAHSYIFSSHARIIESFKNPARLRTFSTIDAFLVGLALEWKASNGWSDSDRISPKKMSNFPIFLLSALVLFASIFIEKVISQNEPNYKNVT